MKYKKGDSIVAISDKNETYKFTCPRNNMCKYKLSAYLYKEKGVGSPTTKWTFTKGF